MDHSACEVVCVGAHPDDVEIGMGATVALLVRRGCRVTIVDLTDGEPTPFGAPETRAREAQAAADALGAARVTLTQPNRRLLDTIEAREELAAVLRRCRPQVLFTPFPVDAHPDHVAASALCDAARFYGKLTKTDMPGEPHWVGRVYRYMAVHQRMVAQPSFIVDVSEHLDTKMEALRSYRSQFEANPANASLLAMVEAQARTWGSLARVEAGEPFFAPEPVAIASPLDLL